MKILIWGNGEICKKILNRNLIDEYPDEIVAIVDNDEIKQGYVGRIKVDAPDNIKFYNFDKIIIASKYIDEIKKQIKLLGYSNEILTYYEYLRAKCAENAYLKKYSKEKKSYLKIFDSKITVYTSITGYYDELKDPLYFDPNIEYICFTNNRNLKSSKWKIEYVDDVNLDDMHLAKKIKLFPQIYLPSSCNTSVWVDGKFQVSGNLREYIEEYQKSKSMLCFPHFERKCIYEEAAVCIANGIGNKSEIIKQISDYYNDGYLLDNGLYEMGCIVRKHNDSIVKKIMEDWWKQILKYSYRDQISFPYVCWKNEYTPDICDKDLYNNQWLLCVRNYNKNIK